MDNKAWKDNNTLHLLTENVVREAQKLDEVAAITYISESLNIDVDNAYNLLRESRGEKIETREEIIADLKELTKNIPIASHYNELGMTVAPASWREE